MKKHNLIGFNDYPGFIKSFVMGFQYMITPYLSLVLLVIVLKTINIPAAMIETEISIAILVLMLYTLLQSIKIGPFGARMLLPSSTSTHFFPQCLLAVKSGGLSLLSGMGIFTGVVQFCLSFFMSHIKKIFPIIIADMIVLVIAVELALIGAHELADFFPVSAQIHHPDWVNYVTDFATVIILMLLEKYGPESIKFFNLLIILLIMYPAIYLLGYIKPISLNTINQSSWIAFHLPIFYKPTINFHFIGAFLIASLVSIVKITGATTTLLQTNSMPMNLKRSANAVAADGLMKFISGVLGTMPVDISSSGIGLSVSTNITARVIAFFMTPIYLLTAFSPKIAALLIYMPRPITGGILIYISSSLFMSSAKQLATHCTSFESKLTIGIPLVLGFTYHTYPSLFKSLPAYINAFTGSSLVVATLTAIILNLIFKLINKYRDKLALANQSGK